VHLHVWMEFCRHLESEMPLPLRRSALTGGEISETRLARYYSWAEGHQRANNDAPELPRHRLEMIVISTVFARYSRPSQSTTIEPETQIGGRSSLLCRRKDSPPSRDSVPSHDGTPGAFPTVVKESSKPQRAGNPPRRMERASNL
jgi:hypothetical protein